MKLKGKFIVHVNVAMIAAARKAGRDDVPTLIVRHKQRAWYARGVRFLSISGTLGGPGVLPQLDCGARVYHTIEGEIELIDPMTFSDATALLNAPQKAPNGQERTESTQRVVADSEGRCPVPV